MSNDPVVEYKVKKNLVRMLAAWNAQYKIDPSMGAAANLYKQHKSDTHSTWRPGQVPRGRELEAAKRKNKEDAKRKAEEEAGIERLGDWRKGSDLEGLCGWKFFVGWAAGVLSGRIPSLPSGV